MPKKYQLLLFDMDGTIAYTDEMIIHTFFDMYDLYNPKGKKTREEIIYFSGPPLKVTLPREFPGYDFDFLFKEFIRISAPYYENDIELFPDEVEVLTKLKEAGYHLSVVTNKGTEKAYFVLERLGIRPLFDFVVGSDDVKNNKPHPEGILTAINRYGLTSKDTLYIGDNDIDYQTASNAGVDAMICAWGPRELKVLGKCRYVAHSYKDIGETLL